MTFPANYNHFITAWESTPLSQRKLGNLIQRLLAAEARFPIREKGLSEVFAAIRFNKKKSQKGKQSPHFSKESTTLNNGNPTLCHVCKKPGHKARDCWSNKEQDRSIKRKPRGQVLIAHAELCLNQSNYREETWYLDSGATDYMCNQEYWFINLTRFENPHPINVGKKGQSIEALDRGDINILVYNGNE